MYSHDFISNFNQGDEKAFRIIFDTLFSQCLFFAMKMTHDKPESEDLTLKAFQTLFSRCQYLETTEEIKAFLYTVIRNSALNSLKMKERYTKRINKFAHQMRDDMLFECEINIMNPLIESIYNIVENLPSQCKTAFKLYYFEEMKVQDIAHSLNISINTVYTYLKRGIKTIKQKTSYEVNQ